MCIPMPNAINHNLNLFEIMPNTCLISKTFDNVMFEVHMHFENILMVNGRATENDWWTKEATFCTGANWVRFCQETRTDRRRRVSFVAASFDMLDANCQRTIQKNCIRTRIGGGVPVASQHTSSKKTTTFGYGQVTAPTPSENWKQSYELSL